MAKLVSWLFSYLVCWSVGWLVSRSRAIDYRVPLWWNFFLYRFSGSQVRIWEKWRGKLPATSLFSRFSSSSSSPSSSFPFNIQTIQRREAEEGEANSIDNDADDHLAAAHKTFNATELRKGRDDVERRKRQGRSWGSVASKDENQTWFTDKHRELTSNRSMSSIKNE